MVVFMERTLFVGDLSKHCLESNLRQLFSRFGTIENVRIVRGKDSVSLNYGFLIMSAEEEVLNAIKYVNGVLFMGRYIKVNHAIKNEFNKKNSLKFKKPFINSIYVRYKCLYQVRDTLLTNI